jgi:hypothetical protein
LALDLKKLTALSKKKQKNMRNPLRVLRLEFIPNFQYI